MSVPVIVTKDIAFIGMKVKRGRDWSVWWDNQDGGAANYGIITKVGPNTTAPDGWVEVKWSNGGTYNYRVGESGKYDLYFYKEETEENPSLSAGDWVEVVNLHAYYVEIQGLPLGGKYKVVEVDENFIKIEGKGHWFGISGFKKCDPPSTPPSSSNSKHYKLGTPYTWRRNPLVGEKVVRLLDGHLKPGEIYIIEEVRKNGVRVNGSSHLLSTSFFAPLNPDFPTLSELSTTPTPTLKPNYMIGEKYSWGSRRPNPGDKVIRVYTDWNGIKQGGIYTVKRIENDNLYVEESKFPAAGTLQNFAPYENPVQEVRKQLNQISELPKTNTNERSNTKAIEVRRTVSTIARAKRSAGTAISCTGGRVRSRCHNPGN
jgi:hypothetical protein